MRGTAVLDRVCRLGKPNVLLRSLATLLAAVLFVGAIPATAFAQEESKNIWHTWWYQVADRENKAEIVLAVVFTFPAMISITPIWAVQRLLDEEKDKDTSS